MTTKKRDLSPKTRIDHAVFGLGTILDSNERYTTIAFDEHGTRKFLTDMVKFDPSDAPPPARIRRKKTPKPTKPAQDDSGESSKS